MVDSMLSAIGACVGSCVAVAQASPDPASPAQVAVSVNPDPEIFSTWIGTAAVPALIAALVAFTVAAGRSRREDQQRVRQELSSAFRAYAAYREFPFAIRRRDAQSPGAERARLSEALREAQASIAYHQRWTEVEDLALADSYNSLIAAARAVIGEEMRQAWLDAPISSDSQMNTGSKVDLSALNEREQMFLAASRRHVRSVGEGLIRRSWRWLRSA